MCSELAQYYLRGPTFVQREPEDPDKLHANVTTMTFHICKSLAEHKETLSRKNDFIIYRSGGTYWDGWDYRAFRG